jgi:hypothetical protein
MTENAENDGDRQIIRGTKCAVEYAQRSNGAMEAKEWLERQKVGIQAKFDHLFRVLADTGRISNEEHFKHLEGEIWEFKRDSDRILAFRERNSWYLTHHFRKGRRRCPPREITRAETIREEFLEILKKEERDNADA